MSRGVGTGSAREVSNRKKPAETPAKAPTVQDVARAANVSAATVSRALSSPGLVSKATLERVHAAVSATGYTINQAARSLRMRTAKTILIALPDIGNPFYSTILDAVVDEASIRGYGVLVANRFPGEPLRLLNEYFRSSRADGMLLFDGGFDIKALDALKMHDGQLPLVVSFDETPDEMVHSVAVDNRAAAMRAVRHLVELGHREIGHIVGPSRNTEINQRLIGFQEAMAEAGLPIRPHWMVQGQYSMPSGVAAAHAMLRAGPLPTAVFAGNDEMAVGFLATLRAAGVHCPEHISVIGFDDIAVAEHYWPPITTMRQPRETIGRAATQILIDILENRRLPQRPMRIEVHAELVVRGSTAPPPMQSA